MKNHLEPLARAANVTQTSHCHVNDVLLTFTFLYIQYSALINSEDLLAHNAVLSSIEQQWQKTDQEVFIAGVLLNPFHKACPFHAAPFSTMAGLYNLLYHLWMCFYNQDPPAELYGQLKAYLTGTQDFQAVE